MVINDNKNLSFSALESLRQSWANPNRTYRPHTRWWWPGNALSKQDITEQMEQMVEQGIGGVEIMNTWTFYSKDCNEYLSSKHLKLIKYAVDEGKRLDLDVSITFSPGWSFGGGWVDKDDQSKCLVKVEVEIEGPKAISQELPLPVDPTGEQMDIRKLEAVVCCRVKNDGSVDSSSLTTITDKIDSKNHLVYSIPQGKWRIFIFYIVYTGQVCHANNFLPEPKIIDHLNVESVKRYCNYLGGIFEKTVGSEFGSTVDSLFCDSFEVEPLAEGILWSDHILKGFLSFMRYDLTQYLPLLWHDAEPLSPRVRYDFNYYMHLVGLEAIFYTFNEWCNDHNLQARIQPHYRFTEELVQGAGSTARPETEVTTAHFHPVADPRKATVSGCKFYGKSHVSAEAYTFLHSYRFRTELQEMKIATDAFLRDGISQFYNHGYFASPEKHVCPTRSMRWANLINHQNVWWKYYKYLADYISRCCSMLRHGEYIADILIYSPQATHWSKRAVWGGMRRVMPYGNLAKTLVANGYDFDIVNDDLLCKCASVENGKIIINGYSYRILILPNTNIVPLETIKFVERFVHSGGVVIALEQLPQAVAGLSDYERKDNVLKEIVSDLFSQDKKFNTYFLPEYVIENSLFNPGKQKYVPTPPLMQPQLTLLEIIKEYVPPDFIINDNQQSDGLTFVHKCYNNVDIYFVTNLQPKRINADITFGVHDKAPQIWDAMNKKIKKVDSWSNNSKGTIISMEFEPWQSAFVLFVASDRQSAIPNKKRGKLPKPLLIEGQWHMKLDGYGIKPYETDTEELASWTDNEMTRNFSGTGEYNISFILADEYVNDDFKLMLDLGKVGMVAEVIVNDYNIGVAWMTPYKLDISKAVKPGENNLTVLVTNVLINYINGLDESFEVPEELQERLGKQQLRGFSKGYLDAFVYEMKMDSKELPSSGLMGPVYIMPFS